MNITYMGMYGENDQSHRTMITFAETIIFQSLIAQDSLFFDIVMF